MKNLPRKPKFLLVDDEDDVRFLLGEYLTTLGLHVEEAREGQEALKIFEEKGPFEVLITDLVMPGLDGLTLIREVKKRNPDTMVLAMTGYSRDYGYVDVVAAGADDLIQKPFILEEFEARLARLLREWKLKEELRALSIRDALTDIFNRRYFEERLIEETYRALRQRYSLCLFMIDVDHFKFYNDTRGHQDGDILLKTLAEILCGCTREGVDQSFRYGGDEFVVLLPHTDIKGALKVAERILKSFRDTGFDPTTLSIGIAKLIPRGDARRSADDLVRRADEAMYRAKKAGGDRIEIDPESLGS
ncbi:diguanylate cyclase [Thermosulfurimonas sp. F29]|uniref:GGDEF domain-containing response regulator n=1 Tax=Thermosulfurimonas sp. F29 TaxID=2867247 RepID=UPI001C837C77|nr:diguanylate cyclase [Thermosulfurimonas sp. F29]MBX6422351.1 diguanylate cyclase [Thermosulfurimonas sp. F29]